jgi:hypothetical protein
MALPTRTTRAQRPPYTLVADLSSRITNDRPTQTEHWTVAGTRRDPLKLTKRPSRAGVEWQLADTTPLASDAPPDATS